MKPRNTEWFISEAKKTHGDKYDYSKSVYINGQTKVCIICPKHGEFWQKPYDHIYGRTCSKCAHEHGGKIRNERARNKFIEKAKRIHGDKYDYSKCNYITSNQQVCIICPDHGEFWQIANTHLHGEGCPECGKEKNIEKRRSNTDEFITKAKQVHGDKYDYSKVEYNRSKEKVCIICPKHGEFWQMPNTHLMGGGCLECANDTIKEKSRDTLEEFITKAKQIHGDKYDYSKVEYINSQTKVCIICPEHGEFWQIAGCHTSGQGCPKCHKFKKTEVNIYNKIKEIFPDAIYHYRDFKTFGRLEIDVFIPSKQYAIEIQGKQHFQPVDYFGGYENFVYTCTNDLNKYNICKNNGIKVFYYVNARNYPNIYIDKLYNDLNELLEDLQKMI